MQKSESIIIAVGLLLSLIFSSKIDFEEGTLYIKLTLWNMSWIMIASILVIIKHLFSRQKIPSQPLPQEKSPSPNTPECDDSPMRPKKVNLEEQQQGQEDSDDFMGESLQLRKNTQSQQDFDCKSSSSLRKRSSSIHSEGAYRKVSFDESLNTVHEYKKNSKLETRNYESAFQQIKVEKKKKNELVKQKRKEENFKKLNINDINKKGRKRKSSLEEGLSQASSN